MQSHANDILNSPFIVNLSWAQNFSFFSRRRSQLAWDHFISFILCLCGGENIVKFNAKYKNRNKNKNHMKNCEWQTERKQRKNWKKNVATKVKQLNWNWAPVKVLLLKHEFKYIYGFASYIFSDTFVFERSPRYMWLWNATNKTSS